MSRANLDLVPSALRSCPQWVVWRYDHRAGRPTKVPYSPVTGGRASTTDRTHWSEFEFACDAVTDDFAGVGFVFSSDDPFCGVDLDDCLDEKGNLTSQAQQIVESLDTYTEISPSGRGLKLFLRAQLPPGQRRRGKVEMYDQGRYFTVTGEHLSGTPTTTEDRQAELDALHAEIFGGERAPTPLPSPRTASIQFADDDDLLTRARAAKNGTKFSALFDHGDTSGHDGDDSAADLALCSHLAFWTGGDTIRMDGLFRRSALMRPKWDERRGESTYGERTIQAALRGTTEFYEPLEQRSGPRRIELDNTQELSPPPSPAEAAENAMKMLWGLGSDPEPAEVAAALQLLATGLDGADPLALQTARAVAMRALKGKLPARDKLVDAALAGVSTQHRPTPRPARTNDDPPYRATESGLVQLKQTKEGEVPILLTNFTAKIVTEIARDDGAEVRRSFEIEAILRGKPRRFEVSAARFPAMGWVTEHLGATAVVNAGLGARDHARAAIQLLSRDVQTRTLYGHLGWRRIGDDWCYLHATGAIGPNGPVPGIETDLPQQLRLYELPPPPEELERTRAVQASLRMLDLLPDQVTVPVFGATWRSVLGPSDHSVHLLGLTGEGKSELAARASQHFGPGLDARHLPGSWSSTANSLEVIAYAAKDALLVVDDFAPEGTSVDVQRMHREAGRLLRAQGNRSGRGRLGRDGEPRPPKMPRGLILSTGEDVPGGQSVRARSFILEVPAGGMDWKLLTHCQQDGAAGLYAQVMSGFLSWVAARYEELVELRPRRVAELRAQAASDCLHRRTPGIVADLAFGLETFLHFAQDVHAISEVEATSLSERFWRALGEAATAQGEQVMSVDPTRRFLELLASAIASGRAHISSEAGTEPETPSAWGWRERTVGNGAYRRSEWQPLGSQVGWLHDGQLYLEPDAAYKAAQGAASLEGLAVQPRTLWKRLKERNLLVTTDEARKRNLVRVTLQGRRREVLHLHPETLSPAETSQTSLSAQAGGAIGTFGTFSDPTDAAGWEEP